MADKDWRPKNWIGQPDFCGRCNGNPEHCYHCTAGYEAGATAMHKADVEYLDEECPGHGLGDGIAETRCLHRKDCPICYAAWKGETK